MKNTIYFWACDYSKISGEGILARKFVKDLKKVKKKRILRLRLNTNLEKVFKNKNNFFHKYLYPFFGIIFLWYKYLNKKTICYINYLPLWNFLIFLLLPPQTILGPITGTISKKKKFFFKTQLEFISSIIINNKFRHCLFANNFYKKKFKYCFHNYIISKLKMANYKVTKKQSDFIIYYRKSQENKNFFYKNLVKELISKNFKISIIGDYLKIDNQKNIKNYGFVNSYKLKKILTKNRYAIANKENLYSFFVQDCLRHNLKVFYNSEFKKFEICGINNFYPVNFESVAGAMKTISSKIKIKNKKNKNIFNDFSKYFNIL